MVVPTAAGEAGPGWAPTGGERRSAEPVEAEERLPLQAPTAPLAPSDELVDEGPDSSEFRGPSCHCKWSLE